MQGQVAYYDTLFLKISLTLKTLGMIHLYSLIVESKNTSIWLAQRWPSNRVFSETKMLDFFGFLYIITFYRTMKEELTHWNNR